MKIYKYTKLDYLDSILKDNAFKLSDYNSFNDPFDCLIEESDKQKKKTFNLYLNYYMFKESYKVFSDFESLNLSTYKKYCAERYIKRCKRFINKIRKTHKYKAYKKIKSIIFFAKLIDKNFKDKEKDARKSFNKINQIALDDIKNNLLVGCFSKTWNNTLMWAHYADSHKGVCVEIELDDKSILKKVEYKKRKPEFDIYETVQYICGYALCETAMGKTSEKFEDKMIYPIYVKSKDWKYEKEIRIPFHKADLPDDVFFNDGLYFLKLGKISRVYLGCRMDSNDIGKAKDTCEKYNVEPIQTKTDKLSFSIIEKY